MPSFDEQLDQSSPRLPGPDPALDAELLRVIDEADRLAARARSRRARRLALGGLAVAGVLGAGGAAAATGIVPWFESAPSHSVVTTASGTSCAVTFGVKEIEVAGARVGAAEQAQAAEAAEAFLTDLDVSELDLATLPDAATAGQGGTGQIEISDDRDLAALHEEVGARMDAELRRQHLPAESVALSMASDCDGGSDR